MSGNLLIADAVVANRVVLKVKLEAARYFVAHASSPSELAASAKSAPPDLVLLDMNIVGKRLAEICADLRRRCGQTHLPILVTASEQAEVTATEVLDAGADDLLRRPITDDLLRARVRSLLRIRDTAEEVARRGQTAEQLGCAEPKAAFFRPDRLAYVCPERTAMRLPANLPERTRLLTDREVLQIPDGTAAPELVMLPFFDTAADDVSLALLSDLRSRAATRHAAILALVPAGQPRLAAQALDLGASDVAAADAPAAEIQRRIRRQVAFKREADTLRQSIDHGLRIAATDSLTGLHNRRYADYHLPRLHDLAAQNGRTMALIIADIDHFKQINDTYGHAVGDRVLQVVAERFRSGLRAADLVARYGGEEFLIALPDTLPFAAAAVAFRLADDLRRHPVEVPGHGAIRVTASFGAALAPAFDGVPAMLARADRALYRAKTLGRDRVEFDAVGAPPALRQGEWQDQGRFGDRRNELSSRSA